MRPAKSIIRGLTENTRNSSRNANGFTLIEVILALAILAGAVAVLGEVMSIAGRSAADAQAEAQAQLMASSVMDEILSGMVDLTQQTRRPLETSGAIPWVYSVTISDTTLVGLMSVEVLVEQDVQQQFRPIKYRLVRWLPSDPDLPATSTEDSESEPDSAGGNGSA